MQKEWGWNWMQKSWPLSRSNTGWPRFTHFPSNLTKFGLVLWSGHKSRFLVPTKRSVAPDDENKLACELSAQWGCTQTIALSILNIVSRCLINANAKTPFILFGVKGSGFCPCVPLHKNRYKTQQCSRAKQRFAKKGVQWLFRLCTSTPRHNRIRGIRHTTSHQSVKLKPTNACQSGVGVKAVESWQRQIEKMFFIIILDLKQLFSLDVWKTII